MSPAASNCGTSAKTLPVCADPTWQLYKGDTDYFCCLDGQKGSLPGKGVNEKGLCVAADVSLAISLSATKVW